MSYIRKSSDMKKPRTYSFILKTTKKAVSVNAAFAAKMIGGHATIYKTKIAREFVAELTRQVELLDIPDWVRQDGMSFRVYLQVIFREGYYMRDLDNTFKETIDAIARAINVNINDSHIVHIEADKKLLKGAPHETIIVSLTENLAETEFDSGIGILPRPAEIFLGGTCSGNDWRKEVIPWLTERRYSYYDPLIRDRDWTVADKIAEDTYKSERADCMFYIITPEQKGMYSVAEIFSEIMQVRENNFGTVLVGFLGSQESWGDLAWKSMLATQQEIKRISGGSKNIVAEVIQSPLDLCAFLNQDGWKGRRKPKNA